MNKKSYQQLQKLIITFGKFALVSDIVKTKIEIQKHILHN